MFSTIKKSILSTAFLVIFLSSASLSQASIEASEINYFQFHSETNLCHPVEIDLVFHGDAMSTHSAEYLAAAISSMSRCAGVAYKLQFIRGRYYAIDRKATADVAEAYLRETALWLSALNLPQSSIFASNRIRYDHDVPELFVIRLTAIGIDDRPNV